MTTVAISGLPVATVINAADIVPFVQAGTTKSISKTLLFTSPALVTLALGTVASGNISACTSTGMVLSTPALSGPTLGTVTSGNISNCTSTSMVMVTPVIGAATGTSLVLSGSLTASGLATTGAITGDTLVLSGASGSLNAVSIAANNDLTANNASIATFIAMSGGVNTIPSAGTIAPVKEISYISGTTAIATITPQAPITGKNGTIILIPTGAFTWTTAGNIAIAGTAVVGRALHMTYTFTTDKWYPSYV